MPMNTIKKVPQEQTIEIFLVIIYDSTALINLGTFHTCGEPKEYPTYDAAQAAIKESKYPAYYKIEKFFKKSYV